MDQLMKWFERKFSFDLPVGVFPNIVERLRGTPARLEDRLGSLPRELLVKRDENRWSIQEHAGHLLDLGTLDLARLDDYAAGRESLRPADLENRKTYEANHNARSIESILTSFRAERSEFVQRLERLDEAFIQRRALHPRLKIQMRILDLAFFIAEHDDHHLARITALIRMFAEMTREELQELAGFLAETPYRIERLLSETGGRSLTWKPSANEFSMLEHICHLRDIEQEGYTVRIGKLLHEDQPALPDIDGNRLAEERRYNTQSYQEALAAFTRARAENVRAIKALSPEQLTCSGMFEKVGPVTLAQLLRMMREHDREHLEALSGLRESLNKQG
jgi:uncharacterized damage-inducible protein DinB